MIISKKIVPMIIIYKRLEFQAYRCLNKKVISLLSILKILGMLQELSIHCLSLEAHSFFLSPYFYTGISAKNLLGFLVNRDRLGFGF